MELWTPTFHSQSDTQCGYAAAGSWKRNESRRELDKRNHDSN
jgi:hypothetical protein